MRDETEMDEKVESAPEPSVCAGSESTSAATLQESMELARTNDERVGEFGGHGEKGGKRAGERLPRSAQVRVGATSLCAACARTLSMPDSRKEAESG
jgi:hypothetical protein